MIGIAIAIFNRQHRQQRRVDHGRDLIGASVGQVGIGDILGNTQIAGLVDDDCKGNIVATVHRVAAIIVNTADNDIDIAGAIKHGFLVQQNFKSAEIDKTGIGIGTRHIQRPDGSSGCPSSSIGAPIGAGGCDHSTGTHSPANRGAQSAKNSRLSCRGLIVVIVVFTG